VSVPIFVIVQLLEEVRREDEIDARNGLVGELPRAELLLIFWDEYVMNILFFLDIIFYLCYL